MLFILLHTVYTFYTGYTGYTGYTVYTVYIVYTVYTAVTCDSPIGAHVEDERVDAQVFSAAAAWARGTH